MRAAQFEQSGKSLKPVNASIVSSRLTFNSDILFPVDKRDSIVGRHSGWVLRNQPRISNERRRGDGLLGAFSTFGAINPYLTASISCHPNRLNPARRCTRSNASRFIPRISLLPPQSPRPHPRCVEFYLQVPSLPLVYISPAGVS